MTDIKKSRFTEEQIVGFLKQAEAGMPIKDADQRAYCLGLARQNRDYCYRIKDADRRNECLANIKGARDRCHAIKDQDGRKACRALIPWACCSLLW